MGRDTDRNFEKSMKGFLAKSAARSGRGRAAYGREAERLLYQKQVAFDHGIERIRDTVVSSRQVMMERLESCEKMIDQQIPLALVEEQRLREAAESWRESYGLEPLDADEAPDDRSLFAWVAAAFSFDAVWTWSLMAADQENILLGGALMLAPPVLTLILAYLASIAIDTARRGKWSSRLWGMLGAVPAVAGGFAVHILAGHYRDQPEGEFIGSALSAPLEFESAGSTWLFFFGAVAFVFVLYKLARARDPIYVYADRLRAWAAARNEVPPLIRYLEDGLQAAIHGTIDEADAAMRANRKQVGEGIVIAETALRQLGVQDPGSWTPEEEGAAPAEVIAPLVAKWSFFRDLKGALMAIGDVRVALSTRPGEEPGDPPREIDKLAEAVRLSEARDWFRRYLELQEMSETRPQVFRVGPAGGFGEVSPDWSEEAAGHA